MAVCIRHIVVTWMGQIIPKAKQDREILVGRCAFFVGLPDKDLPRDVILQWVGPFESSMSSSALASSPRWAKSLSFESPLKDAMSRDAPSASSLMKASAAIAEKRIAVNESGRGAARG